MYSHVAILFWSILPNGSTSLGRCLIIVKVVMSSATLVPGLNFDLSSCLRQPTTYLGPFVALTINFSSVSCLRTSPTIWPTLCKAFKSFSDLFFKRENNIKFLHRIILAWLSSDVFGLTYHIASLNSSIPPAYFLSERLLPCVPWV